jgi:hypothetical protein
VNALLSMRPRLSRSGDNVFRREGEYWTVIFDDVPVRLRDNRGMRHLAALLRQPHTRVAALTLERGNANRSDAHCDGATLREYARVNVTRAVHATLRRIAAHAPALGAHLHATVRTGEFCAYVPDPRAPIAWEVSCGSVAEPAPHRGGRR